MARLAPPEHDRDLDLRPLVQEPDDVAFLRLVVVDSDLRPELDLLDVDRNLMLARDLGFLLLLVAVLAVVHDLGDRRIGLRGDLDKVEILAVGILERFLNRLHSELSAIRIDEPDLRDTDVLVDSAMWDRRPSRLNATSWPQRRFTKLSASSFFKTTRPLHSSGQFPFQPSRLNLRQARGPGGEEHVRPCFAELHRSSLAELGQQLVER